MIRRRFRFVMLAVSVLALGSLIAGCTALDPSTPAPAPATTASSITGTSATSTSTSTSSSSTTTGTLKTFNITGEVDSSLLGGGVDGINVALYGKSLTAATAPLATTITAAGGKYAFNHVPPGFYLVKFLPGASQGWTLTPTEDWLVVASSDARVVATYDNPAFVRDNSHTFANLNNVGCHVSTNSSGEVLWVDAAASGPSGALVWFNSSWGSTWEAKNGLAALGGTQEVTGLEVIDPGSPPGTPGVALMFTRQGYVLVTNDYGNTVQIASYKTLHDMIDPGITTETDVIRIIPNRKMRLDGGGPGWMIGIDETGASLEVANAMSLFSGVQPVFNVVATAEQFYGNGMQDAVGGPDIPASSNHVIVSTTNGWAYTLATDEADINTYQPWINLDPGIYSNHTCTWFQADGTTGVLKGSYLCQTFGLTTRTTLGLINGLPLGGLSAFNIYLENIPYNISGVWGDGTSSENNGVLIQINPIFMVGDNGVIIRQIGPLP